MVSVSVSIGGYLTNVTPICTDLKEKKKMKHNRKYLYKDGDDEGEINKKDHPIWVRKEDGSEEFSKSFFEDEPSIMTN